MTRLFSLSIMLAALTLTACGKTKYVNHADESGESEPAPLEQPNLRDVLGLKGPVQYLGVFTEDDTRGDMNYDTYEFDRDGHLVSIEVAEVVEGSYSETFYFGEDGLPAATKTIFVDYWTNPNGDNYPITTTKYKVVREKDGDFIRLTRELESQNTENAVENPEENPFEGEQGAPLPIARVKLDKRGRIVEVERLGGDPKSFTYKYDDDKPNLAKRDDGKLAIPQADIMGAKHFDYEGLQGQGATAESLMRGIWQFDIKNFE